MVSVKEAFIHDAEVVNSISTDSGAQDAHDQFQDQLGDLGVSAEEINEYIHEEVYRLLNEGQDPGTALMQVSAEVIGFRAGIVFARMNADALRELVEGDGDSPAEGDTPSE